MWKSHWRALCGFHYLPWVTGRKKGSTGKRGGRESGIFLLRFGEFVCLAICVTKKHSLLNFIRRSGRMGVAYDNTLIMHCMLLSPCVCVWVCICVDSLLPADFVVAFACGSCHCSTPLFLCSFSLSLFACLCLSFAPLCIFLAFASTFVARSLYTIRLVLAFNLVCVCEVVVVGFSDVFVAFCQF